MRSVGATRWLALFAAMLAWVGASKAAVTPIQKVIDMLGSMLHKAKEDKQAEMVEWSAFKMFCTNTELEKQTSIQKDDMQKASLAADIKLHDSEAARFKKEIADHKTDVEGYERDKTKATSDRKATRETYVATHADYVESISAVGSAVSALKKRAADIPQASALLQQVNSYSHMPAESKRAINNFLFLQQQDMIAMKSLGGPEANAYEFQSDSIVAMLVELKDKFVAEKTALEKKEMISRQAYDTVMMDLRNSVDTADNEVNKKTGARSEEMSGSTEANTLHAQTVAARDEDQTYLTGLQTTCKEKAGDFVTRQELRAEGIVAVGKAIEIISGGAVSGSAEKHLPKLLQVRAGSSLVQFLASQENPSNQQKAIAFLTGESQRLDSRLLSALAMQGAADPFEKVKKMIGDLISKLKAQEAEEGDHKAWCDKELETNKQTREDKTREVDSLTSTIDQLESRLAVLVKDLAGLSQDIADVNAEVAEATKERNVDKDTNDATIIDAVEGQTAIAQAKKVLTDFFGKADANTAFVQVDSKEPPIFDGAFKGQQTQGNNVVAFLDVIASDFARLESETKKAEESAKLGYDKLMEDSKKLKDAKELEEKTKKREQVDKTGTLSNKNDDLESEQKQLDASMDYFDKLKPSCINVAQPYEERVQRREEEVASLKEALEILNGEGAPSGPDSLYSSTQGGNLAVDYR